MRSQQKVPVATTRLERNETRDRRGTLRKTVKTADPSFGVLPSVLSRIVRSFVASGRARKVNEVEVQLLRTRKSRSFIEQKPKIYL